MSCADMGQMLSTKGWSSEVSENIEKQFNPFTPKGSPFDE